MKLLVNVIPSVVEESFTTAPSNSYGVLDSSLIAPCSTLLTCFHAGINFAQNDKTIINQRFLKTSKKKGLEAPLF